LVDIFAERIAQKKREHAELPGMSLNACIDKPEQSDPPR